MDVVGRFDCFAIVKEPRGPSGGRLLNHPYRFAELPKWWAKLGMALGVDEDGAPAWVFAHDDDDENDANAYRRDVRGWQALSHPLLPRVIGTGKAHGMRWFATSVVFGAPLPLVVERCGEGGLDPALLMSVVHDFSSALAHVIDRRALLTDLIVFDGTLDLEGHVHLHTRASVELDDAEERNVFQRNTAANVARWLQQIAKRPASASTDAAWSAQAGGEPAGLPPAVRHALDLLLGGDAFAAKELLDSAGGVDDARARVVDMFAAAMAPERAALSAWLEEARAIDAGARAAAAAVVPDKPVRRPGGEWYPPTSLA